MQVLNKDAQYRALRGEAAQLTCESFAIPPPSKVSIHTCTLIFKTNLQTILQTDGVHNILLYDAEQFYVNNKMAAE